MSYEDLKAKAGNLGRQLQNVKDEMTAAKRQAQKDLPKPKYKWIPTVWITKSQDTLNDIPAGTQLLTFEGRLSNRKVFKDHFDTYGEISNEPAAKVASRRYWRKNNVLIAQGGGFNVLINHEIVNDEDWEQMKGGNIPDHLLSI